MIPGRNAGEKWSDWVFALPRNAYTYRNPRAGDAGRPRRFFLLGAFLLAFSRRKRAAEQAIKDRSVAPPGLGRP